LCACAAVIDAVAARLSPEDLVFLVWGEEATFPTSPAAGRLFAARGGIRCFAGAVIVSKGSCKSAETRSGSPVRRSGTPVRRSGTPVPHSGSAIPVTGSEISGSGSAISGSGSAISGSGSAISGSGSVVLQRECETSRESGKKWMQTYRLSSTSAKKNGSVPRVWSAPMLGTPDKHRTS
jgi:hypothetical protein